MIQANYYHCRLRFDFGEVSYKATQVYAPLFEASAKLYEEGIAQGRDNQDTACVCAILEDISNLKCKKTHKTKKTFFFMFLWIFSP